MGQSARGLKATVIVEEVKDPEALFRALLPESGHSRRFRTHIKNEGGRVIITITAEDPTALRASINSYLRLLALIDDVEERI